MSHKTKKKRNVPAHESRKERRGVKQKGKEGGREKSGGAASAAGRKVLLWEPRSPDRMRIGIRLKK